MDVFAINSGLSMGSTRAVVMGGALHVSCQCIGFECTDGETTLENMNAVAIHLFAQQLQK